MTNTIPVLLDVRGLSKSFPVRAGLRRSAIRAVDGVSFAVKRGETLGIVGESGCGKSTLARLIMGLMPSDGGDIIFDGQDVGPGFDRDLRARLQMVFQDSVSSLNPRLNAEASVAFGPRARGMTKAAARELSRLTLSRVGLDPAIFGNRFPHQLSGGQKQRVNIARALALSPQLLILDEAVSALDKSIESQILNLLLDLKQALGLTYVFISHDLRVIELLADRLVVMYLGRIVELGPVETIYHQARHPYTQALLASALSADPDHRVMEAPLSGDPPSPSDPPTGCRFHPRCQFAEAICHLNSPELKQHGDGTHLVSCHMYVAGSGHSAAPAPELP